MASKKISKNDKLKYYWARNGRKYRGMMVVFFVLLGGFALSTMNPILATLFPELIGGVLVAYGIYCGGNVASKFTINKLISKDTPPLP